MSEIALSALGLLTLAEAAARRGVHERTLRRWCDQGLPYVPVGGQGRAAYFLFRPADVDAWEPPRRGAPKGNENARKRPAPKKRRAKK